MLTAPQVVKSFAKLALCIVLALTLPGMSWAEEASILGDATVDDVKTAYHPSSYLIDGNFKTMAHSNSNQDYGGSKEFKIILSAE